MTNNITFSCDEALENEFNKVCNRNNVKKAKELRRLMRARIAVDEAMQDARAKEEQILKDEIAKYIDK